MKPTAGIISDGDLIRALNSRDDFFELKPEEIMTKNPKTINKEAKLNEAEKLLNLYDINELIVTDEARKLLGVLLFSKI